MKRWLQAALLFALALALRALWAAVIHTQPQSDFLWYHTHAVDLLEGRGYRYDNHPTAYWPIGYPLFLAGLYAVFGIHLWVGQAANALLTSATAVQAYVLAQRWAGPRAALAAGLALALLPSQLAWSSVLASEPLFTFLWMAGILALPDPITVPSGQRMWPGLIAAGVWLGAASIVRPLALATPLAVAAFYWLRGTGLRLTLQRTAVLAAMLALVVSPVTLRNEIVLKHFVLVSTNGGVNLWQGNNPRATGGYYWSWGNDNPLMKTWWTDEVRTNRDALRLALSYMATHPWRTVKMGFVKWYRFFRKDQNALLWSVDTAKPPVSARLRHWLGRAMNLGYWLVLVLSVVGAVTYVLRRFALRHPLGALWPVLVFAYYVGLFFFFPAWDRFRFPVMPIMAAFAGLGAEVVWLALGLDRQTRSAQQ